jgi:hypothetical protein
MHSEYRVPCSFDSTAFRPGTRVRCTPEYKAILLKPQAMVIGVRVVGPSAGLCLAVYELQLSCRRGCAHCAVLTRSSGY